MHWTRRQFLKVSGAAALVLGLGALQIGASGGRVRFDDWRAYPGTRVRLALEVDAPENRMVYLVAQTDTRQEIVGTLRGAHALEVEVPHVRTSEETYMLFAVVTDGGRPSFVSEPLEVLAEQFRFGL